MPRPKLTPEIAYNLAKLLYRASGERDTRLESVIAQRLLWAYFYAKFVLTGPFFAGEPVIVQDTINAHLYKNLLRTPEDHARFEGIRRCHAQN